MRFIFIIALFFSVSTRVTADTNLGQNLYDRYCLSCHDGSDGSGPDLKHIVGAKVGRVKGFSYSNALLKAHKRGDKWTEARLNHYLRDPEKTYPGTTMVVKTKDAKQRAALITYLKSQK
jgi:cytochrome c2